MSKHTPGLWTIEPVEKQYFNSDTGAPSFKLSYFSIKDSAGLIVANTHDANAEANARLIAAAPEMLEALKLAFECAYTNQDSPLSTEVFLKMGEALAKAEPK